MPKRTGKIVEEIYSKESDEEYSDEQEQDNEYNGTTIICIRDGSIFKKIMDCSCFSFIKSNYKNFWFHISL